MVNHGLRALVGREHTNVMLEGGSRLLGSFFAAEAIDECHVYIGSKAVGGDAAPGPIGGSGVLAMPAAWSMELLSLDRFDDDIRAVYRKTK